MKAIDIAKELIKTFGHKVARAEINKILYGGPFETAEKDGAAPLWRLRSDMVVASGSAATTPTLGATNVSLWIAPGTPGADEIVAAVLGALAKLQVKEVKCDASEEGKIAAQKAAETGIKVTGMDDAAANDGAAAAADGASTANK